MSIVDRAAILSASARRYRIVEVPTLGEVRIQSLTERERSECESTFYDKHGRRNPSKQIEAKATWIVASVVDDHGAKYFTPADIPQVMGIDSAITNYLFDAIWDHIGITEDDRKVLLGNLPGGGTADSPSS